MITLVLLGPGDSASLFIPFFEYMVSSNSSITGYLMDYRGIGGSSSLPYCEAGAPYLDPYNATIMGRSDACYREILSKSGGPERIRFFNTYTAAQDVRAVMDDVLDNIPESTAGIYCVSYGTFFCNTMLQLEGQIDAIVFDGTLSATRWSVENSARTKSMVVLDSIKMCVTESATCAAYLGEYGNIPQMVNDAVNDLSLPCVERLPWLKAANGKFWLSQLVDGFNPTEKKALLGPLYWRLFRCSDSDVQQLNFLFDGKMRQIGMYPYKTNG